MSVAHVELREPSHAEAAPERAAGTPLFVLAGIGMFVLAGAPSVFALLLLIRPDLFFAR